MPETTNNETYQPITFDAIKIGLASPDKIREWSHGEVLKPETINSVSYTHLERKQYMDFRKHLIRSHRISGWMRQ